MIIGKLFCSIAAFALLLSFSGYDPVVSAVLRDREPRIENIICDEDDDRAFEGVHSGIISDPNLEEDRDCQMKLRVHETVFIEIIVNSLYFSSADCDEEYFSIKDGRGNLVPNTTLCPETAPETRLWYNFTADNHTGSEVVFQLRMEEDSDLPKHRQSFINLSFTIHEGSSLAETTSSIQTSASVSEPANSTEEVRNTDATVSNTITVSKTTDTITTLEPPIDTTTPVATDGPTDASTHESTNDPDEFKTGTTVSPHPHVTIRMPSPEEKKQKAKKVVEALRGLIARDQAILDASDEDDDTESSGIDGRFLTLALGLVILGMLIVIIILAIFMLRLKKQRQSMMAGRTNSSNARNKEVNVHVIGHRNINSYTGSKIQSRSSSQSSSSSKHQQLARTDNIYYSEISDGANVKQVLAPEQKASNTYTRPANNRRHTRRLLDSDALEDDSYHRLESLHETQVNQKPKVNQRQSAPPRYHSRPLGKAKLSIDSGVESDDYADHIDMQMGSHSRQSSQSSRVQSSESRVQRTASRKAEEEGEEDDLDKFGYVIVLPNVDQQGKTRSSLQFSKMKARPLPSLEGVDEYEYVAKPSH